MPGPKFAHWGLKTNMLSFVALGNNEHVTMKALCAIFLSRNPYEKKNKKRELYIQNNCVLVRYTH